ncbi:MAG: TadE/TadG family type IV pilus assembly protein [Pseudomonadota bacterium]
MPGFKRLLRESRGQVAIIFALVSLPLLLIVAFAVDYARQVNSYRHLEFATDMASLAGVRALDDGNLSDQAVKSLAEDYYRAQLKSAYGDLDCAAPDVSVEREVRKVTVQGGCEIPTMFGAGIVGQDTLAVATGATAQTKLTALEIAITLDVSGSMRGDKEAAMRDAAGNFVSTLLRPGTKDRVRMSLIPFSSAVNASLYGNRAMGRSDDDDRANDGVDLVCVKEREGVEKYTDARPAPGQWVRENTSHRARCLSAPIAPLSNDEHAVKAAIQGLAADAGGTAGHLGLNWAWYTLSPNWKAIWPLEAVATDYDTPDTVKAVVLLSDGGFNKWYDPSMSAGYRAAWDAITLCDGMQDEGIEIFVIGLDLPPGVAWYSPEQVLRSCAGDAANYFEAEAETLQHVFMEIAGRLHGTWLTH